MYEVVKGNGWCKAGNVLAKFDDETTATMWAQNYVYDTIDVVTVWDVTPRHYCSARATRVVQGRIVLR